MSRIEIIRDFYSYPESITRTVRIYFPDAYDREPGRRFGVLYMCDGQNVFNHAESAIYHTWCANTTMDWMSASGAIPPWIIVAIDHTALRMEEYSPWDEPAKNQRGRGREFVDFLIHHLKPHIDATYRTLPEAHRTALAGASLGGLIGLYVARYHLDVIGRIAAVSPSVMWSNGAIFRAWDQPPRQWCKIYVDVGSIERYWFYETYLDYVDAVESFQRQLRGLGLGAHEFRFVLAEGDFHNEQAWQKRLPGIFTWLLEDSQGI